MKNFIFQIPFLVLFALLLPSQVQSQITTCDDPGNPFWVKVREVPVDPDLADDCFILAYEVYFLANNSSPETNFLASSLSLIGQIESISTNANNSGRAVIREDLTEGPALPGYFNLYNDDKNFSAGFNFLDEYVSVSINSVADEANDNITPYLTFYVEAPAGTDDIDFVWVTTNARFADDDFSEFCTFNNSGLANKEISIPANCTQGGALSLSPTFNIPTSVDLNLNGATATVLDFSLFIEDVHENLPMPTFVPNPSIDVSKNELVSIGNGEYRLDIKLTNSNGLAEIGTLDLGGAISELENEEAIANLNFQYARIGGVMECCTPVLPDVYEVDMGGNQAPCTDVVPINLGYQFIEEGNNAKIEVYFIDASVNFSQFDLAFQIETEGIWHAEVDGADFSCPSDVNCPYDPTGDGDNECFSVMNSGNTILVEMGFCSFEGISLNGGFEINLMPVSGDPDCCINSIGFKRAYAVTTEGTACVPTVDPRSTVDFCKQESDITGDVTYYNGNMEQGGVKKVVVTSLVGNDSYVSDETTCDEGTFEQIYDVSEADFAWLTAETGFETALERNVTTFDLILIRRHILGIQNFNSFYREIAADVNSNQSVTGADMVLIRRLILGLDTEFLDAPDWRFINAEVPITETFSPPSISPLSQYGGYGGIQGIGVNLNSINREAHFIGIRSGDVNLGNSKYCNLNGFTGGDGGEFEMVIKDVDVKSDGHELTFDLKSTVDRTGFQAGIGFDISKLEYEYLTVISELDEFEEENEFATHLTPEGKLNFLWITPDGYAKPVNPELKDIKVKFKSDLTAEELLAELLLTEGERSSENPNGVNSLIYMRDDFKNVAYDAEGNETPIRMTIAPEVIAKLSTRKGDVRFAPNPFDEYTRLMINPEISSNAIITIYNQLGATVLNKRVPDSGMMYIQTPNNWAEGVYYYTVESSTSTYTGKLVKL